MKNILYLTVLFTFLRTTACGIDDLFDLLNEPFKKDLYTIDDFEYVDGMDSYPSLKFKNSSPISISIEKLSFSEATLSSPFIINTVFKLDDQKSQCLFSIVDTDGLKLGLCLTLAGEGITRISLDGEGIPNKQVTFTYSEDVTEWTRILLHVEERKVTIYVNCLKLDGTVFDESVKDIYITKNAILNLAHYGSGHSFLEGAIQEIKIYTDADEETLNDVKVCSEVFKLPDSPDPDDEGDDYPPPENLETFTISKAEKGEKGEKGEQGGSLIGPQGPPGPEGPPGRKGEVGTCACSESVVSSLLKKMPEMRGPEGPMGPKGEIGDTGQPGLTGKPGEQGHRGPLGLKGETGTRGEDGSPGKDGAPGSRGDPGRDGEPGPRGPPGPIGPPGPPGPVPAKETEVAKETVPGEKGDAGPIGPPGTPGPRGERGDKGDRGDPVEKGDKGSRGHDGSEGPRGEKGERGTSGQDGIPGEPGVHGRPAAKGERGEKGDMGSPGSPGSPAKLSSLLDPEMDPEEVAVIADKLRGPKGEIGITGDKGEIGPIGPIGPPGFPGKDGHHGSHGKTGPVGPKGEMGPIGPQGLKGEQGEPGPPGVVSTSTGVIAQGSKGDKGDRGPQGKTGLRGTPGYAKKGATGPRGHKGDKGNAGIAGPAGPRGEQGIKGEKGEGLNLTGLSTLKGEKGDRGENGLPGELGKSGPPGTCPKDCGSSRVVSGPPGPPGPPGVAITGPKGEPGFIIAEDTYYDFVKDFDSGNEDEFYTAKTVIYRTKRALIKRTPSTPLGTLAYVLHEKTLLLRVENGWQYVVMGSLFDARDPYHTIPPRRPMPSHIESSTSTVKPKIPLDRNYIRLVALNEPYSGNMFSYGNRTGKNAANIACYRQANSIGSTGKFVAFLASSVEDLQSVVKRSDQDLPVVNLHGDVLFSSWSTMFTGAGAGFDPAANIYSFNGRNVFIDHTWPVKAVWHGASPLGVRSTQAYCREWLSDQPSDFGVASNLKHNKLLSQDMYPCDNKLIVLCIEGSSSRRRQRHISSRHRNRIPRS